MRVLKRSIRVPQTIQDVEVAIYDFAKLERQLVVRKAKDDGRLSKIRKAFGLFRERIQKRIFGVQAGLQAFAEANRHVVETPQRRSLKLATGTIGWRKTPGRLEIEDGHEGDVKKAIIRKGRKKDFLRVTVEIDREALIKDPAFVETLNFVSIKVDDEFFVKPNKLPDEVATKAS